MAQRGCSLLASRGGDYEFDPELVTIANEDVLDLLESAIQEWWIDRFGKFVPGNDGFFTPPQRGAVPRIHDSDNALICVPTGSGKTLASFTVTINELLRREHESPGGLDNSMYCLYVSPLKSLVNDIHRNLTEPPLSIADITVDRSGIVGIRHAIRHGDASSADRQKMFSETPHILNTTPKTLAILLSSSKFREKLRTTEYVIVDEIHSLAENKRDIHLSVSLERLEGLAMSPPTRIGCSATVGPFGTVAGFLIDRKDGKLRDYELVDTWFVRDFDMRLECPIDDLIRTPQSKVQSRFYGRPHDLAASRMSVLVFTNTWSGAEHVLHNLREGFGGIDESSSGCHHGSLSKERRQEIGSKLKAGGLRVVTASTSLELGIDMPHIDLVMQVGSPKSVAALLQRIGRVGRQLDQTVEGHVITPDRNELVKRAAMLSKAKSGFVDRVFIPENALNVAAQ